MVVNKILLLKALKVKEVAMQGMIAKNVLDEILRPATEKLQSAERILILCSDEKGALQLAALIKEILTKEGKKVLLTSSHALNKTISTNRKEPARAALHDHVHDEKIDAIICITHDAWVAMLKNHICEKVHIRSFPATEGPSDDFVINIAKSEMYALGYSPVDKMLAS